MMDGAQQSVRDPAKPREYYVAYMALLQQYLDSHSTDKPSLYWLVSDYSLRFSRAAYSAGEPTETCRHHLRQTAEYWLRFLTEGTGGKLNGLADIEEYLERLAAAELAGMASDVVAAFRSLQIEGTQDWQKSLVLQACAAMVGEPPAQRKPDLERIGQIKQYADLPALFRALGNHDVEGSAAALDSFLSKSWGPAADRAGRGDLKLPYPAYAGKWSMLSAAVCRRIGTIPSLSKKAMQYVPVDLVPRQDA